MEQDKRQQVPLDAVPFLASPHFAAPRPFCVAAAEREEKSSCGRQHDRELRAITPPKQQSRQRGLTRFAAPPLLAQPHLLGQLRTHRGIIGRNHRVISR